MDVCPKVIRRPCENMDTRREERRVRKMLLRRKIYRRAWLVQASGINLLPAMFPRDLRVESGTWWKDDESVQISVVWA